MEGQIDVLEFLDGMIKDLPKDILPNKVNNLDEYSDEEIIAHSKKLISDEFLDNEIVNLSPIYIKKAFRVIGLMNLFQKYERKYNLDFKLGEVIFNIVCTNILDPNNLINCLFIDEKHYFKKCYQTKESLEAIRILSVESWYIQNFIHQKISKLVCNYPDLRFKIRNPIIEESEMVLKDIRLIGSKMKYFIIEPKLNLIGVRINYKDYDINEMIVGHSMIYSISLNLCNLIIFNTDINLTISDFITNLKFFNAVKKNDYTYETFFDCSELHHCLTDSFGISIYKRELAANTLVGLLNKSSFKKKALTKKGEYHRLMKILNVESENV